MRLPTELTELLTTALSNRAGTVSALAHLAGADTDTVRQDVQALQQQGYLEAIEDTIAYRRPEMPVADMARQTLAAGIEDLTRAARDIDQALESLPALLQAWDTGEAQERTISGEVTHAQAGPGEAWMLHFARDTPKACDICLPDLARLLSAPRNQRVADWTAKAMGALQVRLVITAAEARSAELREALARLQNQGTEVRHHPHPPSFFWVSDREVAGLPLQWGESWPMGVLTVRSGPVAEAMAARFEQIWSAASPIDQDERSWEPILTLLNEGATMEAAGARLGLAHRTARRRVAEAMRHYGVKSQFALGAAWGRDQGRAGAAR